MKIEGPLLLIDYQEKLLPHIHNHEEVLNKAAFLARCFKLIERPVFYTEQNPLGLGETVEELEAELKESSEKFIKNSFSCICENTKDNTLFLKLKEISSEKEKLQIVIAGIETHICVFQTAYDLIKEGFEVFLAQDACGSMNPDDHKVAVDTLRMLGAVVLNSVSIVYAALESALHPGFKDVLKEVKQFLSS